MNHPANTLAARFLFGPNATGRVEPTSWALVATCAALLAWKARGIWTLNVNWDEFYFLTHVHALLRGDLQIPFQTVYAQAFRWLAWVGGGELAQIHVARVAMLLMLALSILQIARLGMRWTSPGAALTGALAFLCLLTTQVHGGSFRADSLLLPVLLGVLLLLTRPSTGRRADIAAGAWCGVGIAISVKFALFAPMFVACVFLAGDASPLTSRLRVALLRCFVIGAVAVAVASVFIGLHQITLPAQHLQSTATFVDRSLGKTVLETSFLPRALYLRRVVSADQFLWMLMGGGVLLALVRRRWVPAVMALAVSPVLFYRNAYPYFYVDMLAPTMVLIAIVVDEVTALARRHASASAREWVPIACGILLLARGWSGLPSMSADEQRSQRQVLEAVHQIFPEPVPYIDEAGMVSTFRKANFFMSTWGIEDYIRRGEPFMATALREFRPPLLLANRRSLNLLMPDSNKLLAEDRDAIRRFYQPYWGPIYIAGARVRIGASGDHIAELPFPGKFRVDSPEPVLVDGLLRSPGEEIDADGTAVRLARQSGVAEGDIEVRLLTAAARPPPPGPAKVPDIFLPL